MLRTSGKFDQTRVVPIPFHSRMQTTGLRTHLLYSSYFPLSYTYSPYAEQRSRERTLKIELFAPRKDKTGTRSHFAGILNERSTAQKPEAVARRQVAIGNAIFVWGLFVA